MGALPAVRPPKPRRGPAPCSRTFPWDRAHAFPERLSGREQQRVAVARALVQDPRLLLADEPTGNLDDATGRGVMTLLERVTRERGRSLVLVTHSEAVAAMADRVLAIEDGHLVPLAAGARLSA